MTLISGENALEESRVEVLGPSPAIFSTYASLSFGQFLSLQASLRHFSFPLSFS